MDDQVKQAYEVSRDGYQPLSLTLTGFKGIRSGLGRDTITLDLEALVADSGAALWIHGHTHDSFDYRLGATRVLANPRGYVQDGTAENPDFDPGLTVQLG